MGRGNETLQAIEKTAPLLLLSWAHTAKPTSSTGCNFILFYFIICQNLTNAFRVFNFSVLIDNDTCIWERDENAEETAALIIIC